MILAIDPAGKTGWCRGKKYGTWDLTRKKGDTKGTQLLNFQKKLIQYYRSVDLIVYEKPGGRFFSGVRSHANLEGIILLTATMKKIPYKEYSATSIKKFITGKGNASKQEVIEAVKELGYKPEDDNQADAIALYLLAKNDLKNGNI